MDTSQFRSEIARMQQGLLDYDRAIPGFPKGPKRDQMVAARQADLEILARWQRQLVYGPSGNP
jgi:hypothetical protein